MNKNSVVNLFYNANIFEHLYEPRIVKRGSIVLILKKHGKKMVKTEELNEGEQLIHRFQ